MCSRTAAPVFFWIIAIKAARRCVWLDSGELEKLEECLREPDAPTVSAIGPQYRHLAVPESGAGQ
jgi:Zn-finger nucleic acid-binding protein